MIVFDFDFNGFVTKMIDFEQKLIRYFKAFFLENYTDTEFRLANAIYGLRFGDRQLCVPYLDSYSL